MDEIDRSLADDDSNSTGMVQYADCDSGVPSGAPAQDRVRVYRPEDMDELAAGHRSNPELQSPRLAS